MCSGARLACLTTSRRETFRSAAVTTGSPLLLARLAQGLVSETALVWTHCFCLLDFCEITLRKPKATNFSKSPLEAQPSKAKGDSKNEFRPPLGVGTAAKPARRAYGSRLTTAAPARTARRSVRTGQAELRIARGAAYGAATSLLAPITSTTIAAALVPVTMAGSAGGPTTPVRFPATSAAS